MALAPSKHTRVDPTLATTAFVLTLSKRAHIDPIQTTFTRETLGKRGRSLNAEADASGEKIASTNKPIEVDNASVLAAVDLLRPHLEYLMVEVDVDPALIAFVLKTKASIITQIRTRTKRERAANGRFYEGPRAQMAREEKKARYLKQRDAVIAAYQLRLLKLNPRETLVFPSTKVFRSEEHVRRMIALIESTQHTLRVAMYVLSHVRLAAAIKAVARRADVHVMVNNTQMHCNGSQVLAILSDDDDGKPSRVQVYVDVDRSYMQHHKYIIVDDRITMHGSVSFSNHAMVSAGIMSIEDDE